MTFRDSFPHQVIRFALAVIFGLLLAGCHSQPPAQHQPTAEEQRKLDEDYKKTMEEQKKLTSGYDKSMQYTPPSTGYTPSKKRSGSQKSPSAKPQPQPQK